MSAKEEKQYSLAEPDFDQLKQYDAWFREHHLIAKMMRERIVDMELYLLDKIDPALAERARRGFVSVEIDWEKKVLIVVPSDDQLKKAEEAEFLMSQKEELPNVENAG